MKTTVVTRSGKAILECLAGEQKLESEADALDLLSACYEGGSRCVLLHVENLPEDFFHLSTGLAGRLLMKFSLYGIRVAALIPAELTRQGKFHEFVLETNRGQEFRVFQDRELAEAWLVG